MTKLGWVPPVSGPTQANTSNNLNAINFMIVLAFPPKYSSADKNYRHYAYNKSILANDYDFFNTFNLSSILVKNDDLKFDEFITNCKAISHASNSDNWKEKKNVKDDSYNNVNKFVVNCILEQPLERRATSYYADNCS